MTKKNNIRPYKKIGLPPGTLIYTGSPSESDTHITIMTYNQENVNSISSINLGDILPNFKEDSVNWINFDSLHKVELISGVGDHFHIHPLILEDILNIDHLPKVNEFETYLFFTLKMVKPGTDEDSFISEHLSFVLGKNFLLSFQEDPTDPFDAVRERIFSGKGKARGRNADYLMFLLTDAIVDQYFVIVERLSRKIAEIELELLENPQETLVTKIIDQKKQLSRLRSFIYPMRDCLRVLVSEETDFVNEENIKYFNDVYDHLIQIISSLESHHESLTSFMEFYATQVSNQMNQVMKTLTVIATIFIPLTFFAGIYGMNFRYMPELNWKWGYPVLLLTMAALGIGMYLYMRRRKWF